MEREESFISLVKDVYEGKFGVYHMYVFFSKKLTHQQEYYIACNNEIELKEMLF